VQRLDLDLREPRERDAAAIAAYLNEHSRALFSETDLSEAEVREWFRITGVWMRLAELEARIVGYVDVTKDEGRPRWSVDARTLDGDVADALLVAAEAHARALSSAHDALRGYSPSVDEVLASAYARAGYRVIRHSFQMRIELPDELDEPTWPEGITVRNYRPEDELRVYEAATEAFEDHWESHRAPFDEWRRYNVERENFVPSLWWVAEDGDEIAGVSQNWWHFSGDKTFGWIGTLGVRRPWRRRGLGRALLLHSFADFKRRGATRVGLGVDAENTTGAVRLYETVGMYAVRRTDIWEKRL
jgi:ribosomal protein S18 acetylase RimI-like enzyme